MPSSSSSIGGAAAAAAAKSVLLSRALMPPLRALLAKQQLTAAYESVERSLLQAFAEVRAGGVAVSTQDLQQQLQLCEWQASVLQQQVTKLLGPQQPQQQQQTQPFSTQGYCSLSDDSIRLLLSQQRLISVSNERLQQQPLLQLLHLGVRTACKRQQHGALPLLRLLVTYCHIQQYQQQLQQLMQQYTVTYTTPAPEGPHQRSRLDVERTDGSTASVVLQPHPTLEPVTGQIAPGWPAALSEGAPQGLSSAGVLGLRPVPALPVLTSAASLAQQGYAALVGPVTVAACVQQASPQGGKQQQQGQQQDAIYVVGKLCSITQLPAVVEARSQSSSQVLPLVNDGSVAAAAAAAVGSVSQASETAAGQQAAAAAAAARLGSLRVWCGATETVREMQLPTAALYSILKPPGIQPQLAEGQHHHHQQQQWQQYGSSGGCPAFLPGWCSFDHLIKPSSSSNSFIGVQLQHLPLLLLASVSQDQVLLSALTQNSRDPLGAAAAAWLPSSGLPQQMQASLLRNIQSGVLDGVPVAAVAAPGVLFGVAIQALMFGHRQGVQREQLGVGEWPKGTNLGESLVAAFPRLEAWREKMLTDAANGR